MNDFFLCLFLVLSFTLFEFCTLLKVDVFGPEGKHRKLSLFDLMTLASCILLAFLLIRYPDQRFWILLNYGGGHISCALVWIRCFSKRRYELDPWRLKVADQVGRWSLLEGIAFVIIATVYHHVK